MSSYVCPHCLSGDFLFENVELDAWRGVRSIICVDGEFTVRTESRIDWNDVGHLSFGCSNQGCDVDTPIRKDELVLLDFEGEPVPKPLPGQEAMPL